MHNHKKDLVSREVVAIENNNFKKNTVFTPLNIFPRKNKGNSNRRQLLPLERASFLANLGSQHNPTLIAHYTVFSDILGAIILYNPSHVSAE